MSEQHDFSRLDAYARARRRVALLNASWRPMLAGALGASLIIVAVWVAAPRFTTREVVVDHVIPRDVTINNLIPHDIPIEIPRIVESSPLARTPAERKFVDTEGWRGADIRGRILRPDENGFVMQTDEGEKSFYPAKLDAAGKVESNEGMKDVVAPYLGELAYCRPSQIGTYFCVALHAGKEVPIPQVPTLVRRGRPA